MLFVVCEIIHTVGDAYHLHRYAQCTFTMLFKMNIYHHVWLLYRLDIVYTTLSASRYQEKYAVMGSFAAQDPYVYMLKYKRNLLKVWII